MAAKNNQFLKNGLVALLMGVFFLFTVATGCKTEDDEADLQLFGPTLSFLPALHKINKDLTADCGTAGSASTTGGTSEGSGSTTSSTSKYDIESYYQFEFSESMLLRYTYDENRSKFTLSPTTSTIQTCQTTDGITCDNVGTQTCETADNIKCGGSKTVIYSNPLQGVAFQAISGTIDYSAGFNIDTSSGVVDLARLELRLVDRSGNVLNGTVNCTSTSF